MTKILIHSATDLITNSSTVIFTYSGSSEGALVDMVNELFKTFGINKTCDEVFDTVILCDDDYKYAEYIENLEEDEYPDGVTSSTDISKLVEDVATGKAPKPDWFNDVENEENHYDYYKPGTILYLIPKEEKYEKLGELIKAFLYSTDHEATRNG